MYKTWREELILFALVDMGSICSCVDEHMNKTLF